MTADMRRRTRAVAGMLRSAWREWNHDHAMMLAAAVAFYAIFSLVPLLVLILNSTALFFGRTAARSRLLALVTETAGARAASGVERLLASASETDAGTTWLSVIVLVLTASAVFRHLKYALNLVLDVPTREERGLMRLLMSRLIAALVAIIGMLLFVVAFGATALIEWVGSNIPALFHQPAVWRAGEMLASFILLSIVFGAILKFVPDIHLQWRHVAAGSLLASLAFTLGQVLIGFYVSHSDFTSAYGTAGSIVLLLVHIYFTVLVLFAAAELTEVLAARDGAFRRERQHIQEDHGHEARKW